jgi:hypothetical protein
MSQDPWRPQATERDQPLILQDCIQLKTAPRAR